MEFKLKYESALGEIEKLSSAPTGTWRHKRPEIKTAKCSQCGWCYLYCPAGTIIQEGSRFAVDLDHCKGCGLCAWVCPADAIMMVEESSRRHGTISKE